jgi:hypothetical protein
MFFLQNEELFVSGMGQSGEYALYRFMKRVNNLTIINFPSTLKMNKPQHLFTILSARFAHHRTFSEASERITATTFKAAEGITATTFKTTG